MAASFQDPGQPGPAATPVAGSVSQGATGGSEAERHEALVRDFFEQAVGGHDMARIRAALGTDFTITHNVRAATQAGPEAFIEVCGPFLTAFPDMQVTVVDLIAAQDRVAVDLLVSGTNAGGWLGHPATGRKVAYKAMAMLTVQDDRISRMVAIDDYCSILQQLGLVVMPEVSRH
jgi:steroid delta-isomerase-like uncharacterized protein